MNTLQYTPITNLTNSEERLIRAMQVLGDKTRYRMFKLIMVNKDMCVTEIAKELGISLSAVSQHFRNFELIGLVDKERVGQKICYVLKADDPLVNEIVNMTLRAK